MRVKKFDHVNIISHDMERTATFYADLLNLRIGDGPPPFTRQQLIWMVDENNHPIIHINAVGLINMLGRTSQPADTSGAVHHIAFDCEGHDDLVSSLKARGVEFGQNAVKSFNLQQIFVVDPNGVLVELNFRGE